MFRILIRENFYSLKKLWLNLADLKRELKKISYES